MTLQELDRTYHSLAGTPEAQMSDREAKLSVWIEAQNAAHIMCSLCGQVISVESHLVDPKHTSQFICGLGIPIQLLAS